MKARTSKHPKKPPRFVPTLTDVVTEAWMVAAAAPEMNTPAVHAEAALTAAQFPDKGMEAALQDEPKQSARAAGSGAGLPADSLVLPLRSEQDVFDERSAAPALSAKAFQTAETSPAQARNMHTLPAAGSTGSSGLWPPDRMEAAVFQRVMQHVDLGLDSRLRDAIARVVLEQTRSLLPRLREEVESVVRQVVCEAMADEVANSSTQKANRS